MRPNTVISRSLGARQHSSAWHATIAAAERLRKRLRSFSPTVLVTGLGLRRAERREARMRANDYALYFVKLYGDRAESEIDSKLADRALSGYRRLLYTLAKIEIRHRQKVRTRWRPFGVRGSGTSPAMPPPAQPARRAP